MVDRLRQWRGIDPWICYVEAAEAGVDPVLLDTSGHFPANIGHI